MSLSARNRVILGFFVPFLSLIPFLSLGAQLATKHASVAVIALPDEADRLVTGLLPVALSGSPVPADDGSILDYKRKCKTHFVGLDGHGNAIFEDDYETEIQVSDPITDFFKWIKKLVFRSPSTTVPGGPVPKAASDGESLIRRTGVFENIKPPAGWTFRTDGATFLELIPPEPFNNSTSFSFSFETNENNPNAFQEELVTVDGSVLTSGFSTEFRPMTGDRPSVEVQPYLADVRIDRKSLVTVAVHDPSGAPMSNVPIEAQVVDTTIVSVGVRDPVTDSEGLARLELTGKAHGYSELFAVAVTPLGRQVSSGIVLVPLLAAREDAAQ